MDNVVLLLHSNADVTKKHHQLVFSKNARSWKQTLMLFSKLLHCWLKTSIWVVLRWWNFKLQSQVTFRCSCDNAEIIWKSADTHVVLSKYYLAVCVICDIYFVILSIYTTIYNGVAIFLHLFSCRYHYISVDVQYIVIVISVQGAKCDFIFFYF